MEDLPRKLGLLDATVIVIGIVIGSGIFLLPHDIAERLPSGPAILAIWVAAGILSCFGSMAYAELGAMMPSTGGHYVFLREAYGRGCAFLCGWVFVLAGVPGGMAFLAAAFSRYLGHFLPLTPGSEKAAALFVVAVLSAVNYIGVKEGAWVQRVFTVAKVAGLLLVIGAAALAAHVSRPAEVAPHALAYTGIGFAMAQCLMAYNGWAFVSFVAGEVRRPQRNLPLSLAIGMAIVMVLYLSANLAYMNVMTVPEIAATKLVGAEAAERAMGPIGASVLSAAVLISIIGAINGNIMTGPRISFAQARDGLFFSRFGRIHPRFETPAFAIVVQGLWTGVLVLTGSYAALSSYTIVAIWIFYTLSVLGVWILRRKLPEAPRPYRMWGYPVTLWLFVAVSVWFLLDSFVSQPVPALAAFGITAAGIPFYFLWRRGTARRA